MPHWNTYHLAHTLEDAVKALANAPGPARVIAGGTDLLLDLQQGRHPDVHTLVDITEIPELTMVGLRQDFLYVGAAVPLNRIVASPEVAGCAQALIEACGLIAGPQVRNTATLGGNVAHGLPAADGTIALMSLDAQVEIAGPDGCRRVPLEELFLGPGKTALKPVEILTGFYIPVAAAGQSAASAFKRIMRPQGVALPILNCAVWVSRQDDRVEAIHIAVGPGGPVPFRARQAEAALQGQRIEAATVEAAVTALLQEARFRSSAQRASAEYRRHLASGLFEDTLRTAWTRTGAMS